MYRPVVRASTRLTRNAGDHGERHILDPVRIILINESRLAREGIARLLEDSEQIEVCSHHGSVEYAIPSIIHEAPDVVVLDLIGLTDCSPVSTIRAVRHETIIVVSGITLDEKVIIPFARAGVGGYIQKMATSGDWVRAISEAAEGRVADTAIAGVLNRFVAESRQRIPHYAAQPSPLDSWRTPPEVESSADRVGLTPRERQVLTLVDRGLSTKHIARKLGCSPSTVKAHIQAVFGKYNVHRRSEAAALFRESQESHDTTVDRIALR